MVDSAAVVEQGSILKTERRPFRAKEKPKASWGSRSIEWFKDQVVRAKERGRGVIERLSEGSPSNELSADRKQETDPSVQINWKLLVKSGDISRPEDGGDRRKNVPEEDGEKQAKEVQKAVDAEKASKPKNTVGLDIAGETEDWFYIPKTAWYPHDMLSRGGSGARLDVETLLHPDVADRYVVNVIGDLVECGTLRNMLAPGAAEKLEAFVQKLEPQFVRNMDNLTPEKQELVATVGALVNYVLASHEFATEKRTPQERHFGPREAHFSPFSIPDAAFDLLEQNVYKDNIPQLMAVLQKHIEYKGRDVISMKKQGIVKACQRAEEIFIKEKVELDDILSIHQELVSDSPRGGQINHNPNTLREIESGDLDSELDGFMTEFNTGILEITPQTPQNEVIETATELMKKWTDMHATHDANGRLSRIIGNAILIKGGQELIPVTVPNKWEQRIAIEDSERDQLALQQYWRRIMLPTVKTWEDLIAYEKGSNVVMPEPGRETFHPSLRDRVRGKIGEGRQKKAFAVDEDKAWVRYHGKEFQGKPVEFSKAQFFMHRILHLLAPNNFPDVFMAAKGGILLERAPETPDFIKAKEIIEKYGTLTRPDEEGDWMDYKMEEIYKMPKFQEIAGLLDKLGVGEVASGSERSFYELAVPVNTVIVDNEPLIIELFDPITIKNIDNQLKAGPTIQPDGLNEVLESRLADGKLDEKEAKEIKRMYQRYYENAKKAVEIDKTSN